MAAGTWRGKAISRSDRVNRVALLSGRACPIAFIRHAMAYEPSFYDDGATASFPGEAAVSVAAGTGTTAISLR